MRIKKCIIKKTANKVLQNAEISKKVYIYFSTKVYDDWYDPYEDKAADALLNPLIIKAYVREVSPEALVWKSYGLANIGAVEVLCDKKYKNYFEKAARIEIESVKYQVFKEGTGNRTIISTRPMDQIRVVLTRLA